MNEWDEDVLTIGTSDDSAQNLPLVHDAYGCPGLQVRLSNLSICRLLWHMRHIAE